MEPEVQSQLLELKRKIDIDYMREDIPVLLDESMDGLQRVKIIVRDLKSFSRTGSSEQALADLEQGLDSTLNVVWNELKHKSEVIKEYAGLPEVQCILSQLNQVFMNLLVNAANAIEVHGRITLRTGHDLENVWVEVEDTGKGIPPENLARIFEPFFTTKPVGQGTGLGLSLSYGIVQQHGGRIEVTSVVGQGSTFRVLLPRQTSAGSASNPLGAEAAPG
jgi:signal transduction histidine kinase